jgi:hypothetical protein
VGFAQNVSQRLCVYLRAEVIYVAASSAHLALETPGPIVTLVDASRCVPVVVPGAFDGAAFDFRARPNKLRNKGLHAHSLGVIVGHILVPFIACQRSRAGQPAMIQSDSSSARQRTIRPPPILKGSGHTPAECHAHHVALLTLHRAAAWAASNNSGKGAGVVMVSLVMAGPLTRVHRIQSVPNLGDGLKVVQAQSASPCRWCDKCPRLQDIQNAV